MSMDMFFVLDAAVFLGFIAALVSIGIVMSRHEKDSESYFLAGRGLSWWLIGFSLIAANISTEQFVGMSGQAADYIGLAIASYEWMAAVTLVVVAFFFLPKFLSSVIYTIPEFLEHRYNHLARTIMSLLMMIMYVGVTIAAVIYSGALTIDVLFGGNVILGVLPVNVVTASWIIGLLAAAYVAAGGLKACAWADLLQGSALIVGGAVVVVLAMMALGKADPAAIGLSSDMAQAGAIEKFRTLNADKLHMVLPASDQYVPWTALVIGLWIPNFYYWGLNQYIAQRTLGARSLAEGQKGIVFAAGLKLIIPFIIVVPGIIAFNLYSDDMREEAATKTNKVTLAECEAASASSKRVAIPFNADFAKLYPEKAWQIVKHNQQFTGGNKIEGPLDINNWMIDEIEKKNATLPPDQRVMVATKLIGYQFDSAFALLIKKLIPPGLRGFMLAAILGAVTSSLASMLNAASTIFTMDIFSQYINPTAPQKLLVTVGRICVIVFVAIGCLIAPLLGDPRFGGVFTYIQEFQGFISPGVLAIFVFGMFVGRAPRSCGTVGLLLSPIAYGILKLALPELAFLDRMAITFFSILLVMGLMTVARPLPEPVTLPKAGNLDLTPSRTAQVFGVVIILATAGLYIFFL